MFLTMMPLRGSTYTCSMIFLASVFICLPCDSQVAIDNFQHSHGSLACEPCWCNKTYGIMSCHNLGLKAFFSNGSRQWNWVENLNLSKNHLRSMPDLSSFSNLKILSLNENNEIVKLDESSFLGVEKLEKLDMTGLSLSTVHHRAFAPLKYLQSLRMKRSAKSLPGRLTDFGFLRELNGTLEELYIDGAAAINIAFHHGFQNLSTLSLGGGNCDITKLTTEDDGLASLRILPLKKLSFRNCGINFVTKDYFSPLTETLHTLDFACNPVRESMINILAPFQNYQNLKRFLGDFINQWPLNCEWNITSDYFLPSLEIVSMSGNHINDLIHNNMSKNLKSARYVDVGFNKLDGAGFNILHQCNISWFWCANYVGHKYNFLGIDGITNTPLRCNTEPPFLKCNEENILFEQDINEQFGWEKVNHPEYLDIFILLDFFHNATGDNASRDLHTYITNHHNDSSLSPSSVVRILVETMKKYPETEFSFLSYLDKRTTGLAWDLPAMEDVVKYFCDDRHVEVLISVLERWIKLHQIKFEKVGSWTNIAINSTIRDLCAHPSWNYGINFISNRLHFRPTFTNLTTLSARKNKGSPFTSSINRLCYDIVFYFNNFRHLDASFSEIKSVACKNFTGLEAVERIDCIQCQNEGGWQTKGSDVPNLTYVNFSGNKFGAWLSQSRNAFKGFYKIKHLDLSNVTHPGIKEFRHVDMFSDQHNMEVLILRNSWIRNWTVSLVNNSALKILDLSQNRIRYISKSFRDDLQGAHHVSKLQVLLAENPIECECNTKSLDFINWILSHRIIADRKLLRCESSDGTYVGKSLALFRHDCERNPRWALWKTIAIGCAGTAFILVSISTVVLITRRISPIDRHRRGYWQLPTESLPRSFISFPRRMEDDVNALKELTQNHFLLLSTLWGDFDDSCGETYSTILSEVIRMTSKIILIVSEHYFLDDDTRREYYLFEKAGLITADKVILVLTTPNIGRVQLPPLLNTFYTEGKFLIWPMGPCSGQDFKRFSFRLAAEI